MTNANRAMDLFHMAGHHLWTGVNRERAAEKRFSGAFHH